MRDLKIEPAKKSIFISRDLDENSPLLKTLTTSGHTLIHQSLIKIEQVRFTYTPNAQWIFFSSKNAIAYFFAQKPFINPTIKFGVMSDVSAKYLATFDKKASFIGNGVDVKQIAKEFGNVIKDETVCFPQAIDSLQTIQKQLSFTNNFSNIYVYKTTLKTEIILPATDILIFTSPSNTSAYLQQNKIEDWQKVIAIGSSTQQRLKESGVKEIAMPQSFDEQGLLEVVLNLIEETISA